ncbi:MAG: argininosuccinate lyase [Sediminibacterium sp.]|nr:argininosuccinate lyase [Sediminibacterium sp.]
MDNKLWQKNHSSQTSWSVLVNEFTAGKDRSFDEILAEYDVLGSKAHCLMLLKSGLLISEDYLLLDQALNEILADVQSGNFKIQDGVEDIHSQIEFLLTQKIGEAGKKIHTARSRNDQVLVDLKLYFKHEIKHLVQNIETLFNQFINLSEQNKTKYMPGYTHFQLAMPSSFGLWFGAYAEALTEDLEWLAVAYSISNKNPLGSAAGYGSSFPIHRGITTQVLDFTTMNYNSMYAQMTRGKTEKAVAIALASVAATLSKFSYDVILFLNQQFDFISFPSDLSTGSSIMPHKKNPDVFELIRAKSNRIQAIPNELTILLNNLPSGYHRDFQLTKEIIFPALKELKECLKMMSLMLEKIIIKDHILADPKYNVIFSVEEINKLVEQGVSFREAYRQVAESIDNGSFQPEKNILHTHEGSLGNLCNDQIIEAFNKVKLNMK